MRNAPLAHVLLTQFSVDGSVWGVVEPLGGRISGGGSSQGEGSWGYLVLCHVFLMQ